VPGAPLEASSLINDDVDGVSVCRIAIVPDEKVTNAALFKIAREDHTVGNLLRM